MARSPAIRKRTQLAPARRNLRSTRSTITPIGIAKNNHGNITNALSTEMRTGFLVSVIAKSGAAADKTPSARFVVRLAPHSRLKAGPSDFIDWALTR